MIMADSARSLLYSDSSDPLTLFYAAIRRVALAPSDNVLMNDGLP